MIPRTMDPHTWTTTEESDRSCASHTHSADAMLSLRVARYLPSALQDMICPTPSFGFGLEGSGFSEGMAPRRAAAYVISTSLLELMRLFVRVDAKQGGVATLAGGGGGGNACVRGAWWRGVDWTGMGWAALRWRAWCRHWSPELIRLY